MTALAVRTRVEQWIIDVGLGATAIHAGVRLFLRFGEAPAGVVLGALNVVVGGLFLLRRAPEAEAAWAPTLGGLASAAMGAVHLHLAPPLDDWPTAIAAVFAIFGGMTIASLLVLGRSFAILPSSRGVVEVGPYRLVRHPAYASELGLVACCVWARPSAWAATAAALTVALLMLRIHLEEQHLRTNPAYRRYAESVRWRLVPRVW